MLQCRKCLRIQSAIKSNCKYCEADSLDPIIFEYSRTYPKSGFKNIVFENQSYQIKEELGEGGFGGVFKVYDPGEKKYFAMKVPIKFFEKIFLKNQSHGSNDTDDLIKVINKEIEMVNKFKNDNFLLVKKTGEASVKSGEKTIKFPAILMELAEGTLEQLIQYESKGNPIIYDDKVNIIRGILDAVNTFHGLGGVHRDLSPGNLFIVDRNGEISFVLGDLGISKDTIQSKSNVHSSAPRGNPYYTDSINFCKPEYSRDKRLDIFSLGVIITEILMGRTWRSFLPGVTLWGLFDFEKKFLAKYGDKYIGKAVIHSLCKAVKKDIEQRYMSIQDFKNEFLNSFECNPTYSLVFHFLLELPFRIREDTIKENKIEYNSKHIELSDFRGAEIVFENFVPLRVKIKSTDFYKASSNNKNSLMLTFQETEFKEKSRDFVSIIENCKGELHFRGVIEVVGMRSL